MAWLSTCNLRMPGSKKLSARWLGTFAVERRIIPGAYRLHLPAYFSGLHSVFHVSFLKPYVAGSDGTKVSGPDPILIDGLPEWKVSLIIQFRSTGDIEQFIIAFKGFPLSEAVWLSRTDLDNGPDVLAEFERL